MLSPIFHLHFKSHCVQVLEELPTTNKLAELLNDASRYLLIFLFCGDVGTVIIAITVDNDNSLIRL